MITVMCPPTERYSEDDADLALELTNIEAYHRILSASAACHPCARRA